MGILAQALSRDCPEVASSPDTLLKSQGEVGVTVCVVFSPFYSRDNLAPCGLPGEPLRHALGAPHFQTRGGGTPSSNSPLCVNVVAVSRDERATWCRDALSPAVLCGVPSVPVPGAERRVGRGRGAARLPVTPVLLPSSVLSAPEQTRCCPPRLSP